jgi:hypothetical protein
MPFPTSSLLLLAPTPPGRTCFALLFSNFANEKNLTFLLFKVATQGVSL